MGVIYNIDFGLYLRNLASGLNFSRSCGSAALAVRTPCVFLRSASNKHAGSMAGEGLLSRGGDVEKSYVARACDARSTHGARTAKKNVGCPQRKKCRTGFRCGDPASCLRPLRSVRRTHAARTEWPKTLDFFLSVDCPYGVCGIYDRRFTN